MDFRCWTSIHNMLGIWYCQYYHLLDWDHTRIFSASMHKPAHGGESKDMNLVGDSTVDGTDSKTRSAARNPLNHKYFILFQTKKNFFLRSKRRMWWIIDYGKNSFYLTYLTFTWRLNEIHLSPFDIPCPHDVSHPVVFYGNVFFLWDGRHNLYLCRYFDGPFQCVYRSRVHGRLCRGKARNCRNSRTRGYFALFTLWR